MNELHCTGCLRSVLPDHKCKYKHAKLMDPSSLKAAKGSSGKGFKDLTDRLMRIENKLDAILAMADARRRDRVAKK